MSEAPAATRRLAYEPLSVAHTPALGAWAEPQLYRWIGPAPTPAQLAARIARITTMPPPPGEIWRNWVVRRIEDGACVGVVETTVCPARAHLAYFIFPAFQRRGYAREACAAAIGHLRARDGVREIVASVDTRNIASQRLLESLGFARDETPVASTVGEEASWDYRYRLGVD